VSERLETVADPLGLTPEQCTNVREAHATFAEKYEAQRPARRDLRREEFKAMGEVLTPEQREKVKGYIEDRVESLKNP
jgi:Spy/CpxP family protein refolding chaperone